MESVNELKPILSPRRPSADCMNRNGSAPLGDSYSDQWQALSAWFLGPRAENGDVFLDTFQEIFKKHVQMRKSYYPSDPAYITQDMKSSHAYRSEIEDMREELMRMHKEMEHNASPSSLQGIKLTCYGTSPCLPSLGTWAPCYLIKTI